MIHVKQTNEDDKHYHFAVTIEENGKETHHRVMVGKDYLKNVAGEYARPEDVMEWSFRFLLEHEPKEAILPEFDLSVIQTYFDDYEETARKYFASQ